MSLISLSIKGTFLNKSGYRGGEGCIPSSPEGGGTVPHPHENCPPPERFRAGGQRFFSIFSRKLKLKKVQTRGMFRKHVLMEFK